SHPGDADALSSTLHDTLGLGAEGATVEVRGATGTVERVGERQTLVRLTAPVPGMLNVFVYGWGDGKATAGVRAYLFSADAGDYVRRGEAGWPGWAHGVSLPGRSSARRAPAAGAPNTPTDEPAPSRHGLLPWPRVHPHGS